MKKSFLRLSFALTLAAASVLLSAEPPAAQADAGCCAKCGPDRYVCCSGTGTCYAEDGWGCQSFGEEHPKRC